MRRFLKWTGIVVGSLVVLVLVAGGVLALRGRSALKRVFPEPPPVAAFRPDPSGAERGAHLVRIAQCQECHAEDLGGKVFLDIPPGRFVASNLTSGKGGVGPKYATPRDWDRAVRFGLRPDRTQLVFMPSDIFHRMGDADGAAVAAYLAALPPVDRVLPPTEVRTPGHLMLGMPGGAARGDALDAPAPVQPPRAPTAEYGRYLASFTCAVCHGDDLRGGHHPDPEGPAAPSLVHAGRWEVSAFARTVRQGVRPNGSPVSNWMPTRYYAEMDDVEIGALHAYLRSLPETAPDAKS